MLIRILSFCKVFNIYVCHHANNLAIRVKDKEHIGATYIASCNISSDELIKGEPIEGWFDLLNGNEQLGRINLSVQYFDKNALGEVEMELNDAYFPMRSGNRVVLYQDADTPQLPQVRNLSEMLDGFRFPGFGNNS